MSNLEKLAKVAEDLQAHLRTEIYRFMNGDTDYEVELDKDILLNFDIRIITDRESLKDEVKIHCYGGEFQKF